ncbi:ABC transporter permease [Listeria ivanovii]|uniref:ABC transporter permease n=1 Tax=Listeria ivanovii TaxID=1638 RepID=UPI000DAABDED|nr:ABC transporter permease [Listeria ivanovii]PZF91357.1 ABC transporter permease [Listeria ivanovii]PZF96865.1 ABC transporter permease [Listeria ivanovii]PZG06888.1 ABC transporter permease [Listeria ivanovii]PZG11871.1 ABC transporter permease [Listeria ivanovii]PZG28996.1 ABC transporter permease [Listeria ivanovii]
MKKMITFYLKQISPVLVIGLAIILGLNLVGLTMNLLEGPDLLFRAIRGTTVMSLLLVLISTWKITKLDTSKENLTLVSISKYSEVTKFFGKLFAAYLAAIAVILTQSAFIWYYGFETERIAAGDALSFVAGTGMMFLFISMFVCYFVIPLSWLKDHVKTSYVQKAGVIFLLFAILIVNLLAEYYLHIYNSGGIISILPNGNFEISLLSIIWNLSLCSIIAGSYIYSKSKKIDTI